MPSTKKFKSPPKYRIELVNGVQYAADIGKLIKTFFEEDGPTTYIGTEWWLVFDPEGLPVGVAGMLKSALEPDTYYLNRSGILEAHRGHGLQRKLITARVSRAKDLKAKFCTSDTWDNPHSANNLIASGFRAYRPEKPWRCEGVMYWRLKL